MLLTLALVGGLCVGTSSATPRSTRPAAYTERQQTLAAPAKPNIVFILTDDLSRNLVAYMSAVRAMKNAGTTFDNFFVTDSLCCPSRASILTGRYPHNTRVLVNEGDRDDYPGGYQAFKKHGHGKRTYAVALDDAGYRTGFLGKYLNGYKIRRHGVPRGWDEWHVSANGYTNLAGSYLITDIRRKGGAKHITKPRAYMNDLLGARARAFVDRAKDRGQPFFLQLSTFAPHARVDGGRPRFPAARPDRPGGDFPHGDCGTRPGGGRYDCADLGVRRTGAFDDATYDRLDRDFRNRVRMMQTLNDQIIDLRRRLASNGQLRNTYFVFAADNGFHLGQHGLLRGKGSAYDHDVRVPLIVEGPRARAGQVRHEIVQTVDLSPTFQQLAELRPRPTNGHGLLDLLRGAKPKNWRDAALVEHKSQRRQGNAASDPDLDGDMGSQARRGFVPAHHSYNALRTRTWLYVRYTDGSRPELYDLASDAGQHHNVAGRHPRQVRRLSSWLTAYTKCGSRSGGTTCWKAGQG
jgi:N-acetylglucosamine-6-sulfatase